MAEKIVYIDSWNYIKLTVTETAVKVAENKSTIRETLQLVLPYNTSSFQAYNTRAKVTGSNETNYGYVYWTQGTHTLAQATYDVAHNTDGTKSYTSSGYLYSTIGNWNISCNITLTPIDRIAVVSDVTDFNDETNPTITYTNPLDFRINAYMAVGNTRITTIENIASTGSYTFNLTTAQRNQLRQLCTGQTLTVRLGIATCVGGTEETGWSYIDKTMTLVNANPTFTATYQDTNATTLAITNNNQQIIRNNSTLQINTSNATALKYATLSSFKAEINGTTYNGTLSGSTGTISVGVLNLSSNTPAKITLTDSRGLTSVQTLNLEILDWYTPTGIISLGRKNNFYTETDITVDADYASLDNKNAITIKCRSKKTTSSTYGAYTTLSDNVQSTLSLDNLYEWDVQVLVQDLIGSSTYNLTVGKGIPIVFFDRLKRSMGLDCFPQNDTSLEINGDLYVNAVNILEEINKLKGMVLWENPHPTDSFVAQNITLNSNNYNYYEIIYQFSTVNTNRCSTGKVPKGSGTMLTFIINTSSVHGNTTRDINYVSDTVLHAETPITESGGTSNTNRCIPIMVVGYVSLI